MALGLPLAAVHPDHTLPAPAYNWRLVLSYDGTRFRGWQYQPSTPTIQSTLEQALTRVTKLERKDLCLVGASRTDTGVHAFGQVAHFVTSVNYDELHHIHAALNGLLPPDIRVKEIAPALPEFHARFSVTGKIYRYTVYNDTVMDPFHRLYAFHNLSSLNTCVMEEAAKYFVGKHDFSAFANAQRNDRVVSTVKNISRVDIIEKGPAKYFVGKHDFSAFANAQRNDRVVSTVKNISRVDIIEKGPLLHIEVEGSGFLYRQVRNMVALLLQIGREAIPPDIVSKILATRDRKELAKVALVAPPHGLSLVQVKYNAEHLRLPEDGPATSFGRHHSISKCTLQYY